MKRPLSLLAIVAATALASCSAQPPAASGDRRALDAIETVVVIYAENRAFDNLYGLFPGANGIPGVNPTAAASTCRRSTAMARCCRRCRRRGAASPRRTSR